MKKVVSFSLWGDCTHFTQGAIENARSINTDFYHGWECWIYINDSVNNSTISKLESTGAIIKKSNYHNDYSMLFERFKPMAEGEVSIFISRDCDSRISDKEYQAVTEWESSHFQFHSMRDHFHHHLYVMGGMWGAKTTGLVDTKSAYKKMLSLFLNKNYNGDQVALQYFYQSYNQHFLEHDDNLRHNGKKFPEHQEFVYGSFIGERICADNTVGPIDRWEN